MRGGHHAKRWKILGFCGIMTLLTASPNASPPGSSRSTRWARRFSLGSEAKQPGEAEQRQQGERRTG